MSQVQTGGTEPKALEREYSELEKLLAREVRGAKDLPVIDGVVVPQSAEGFYRLAQWYVNAGMVPDSLRGPDAQSTTARAAIAISAGAAVGLSHTQAMANVMVVNSRPSMWGDALIAVVRRSPECVEIIDTEEGETAICRATRIKKLSDGSFHRETREARFSQKDAERGGLLGKGPWKSNPARMRQNRARAFALRDLFADLLMGIGFAEEEEDIAAARRHDRGQAAAADVRGAMDSLGGTEAPASSAPKPTPPADAPAGGLTLPVASDAHPATPKPDKPLGVGDENAQPPDDAPLGVLPGMESKPTTVSRGSPRTPRT